MLILVFVTFLLKNGNQVVSGITSAAKATTATTSTSTTDSGVASGISSFGTQQNNTNSGAPNGTGSGSTDYSGYVNTAVSLFGAYEGMG